MLLIQVGRALENFLIAPRTSQMSEYANDSSNTKSRTDMSVHLLPVPIDATPTPTFCTANSIVHEYTILTTNGFALFITNAVHHYNGNRQASIWMLVFVASKQQKCRILGRTHFIRPTITSVV